MRDMNQGCQSKTAHHTLTPRVLKGWHSAFKAMERAKKVEARGGTMTAMEAAMEAVRPSRGLGAPGTRVPGYETTGISCVGKALANPYSPPRGYCTRVRPHHATRHT